MIRQPFFRLKDNTQLEEESNFSLIHGQKVLVFLDEQNLTIGAHNLGYMLDYKLLAKRIHTAADYSELHMFIADEPGNLSTKNRFMSLGYIVHTKVIRFINLLNSTQRRDCNIDNLFAFWVGSLVAKDFHDVIILASGDYGLSGELAQAIRIQNVKKTNHIMTLSLPGSTAQKLNAKKNPHISANLEIGLDLLRPLKVSNRLLSARALCRNNVLLRKFY